ncbi:MAG: hypothetical protein AVDCRST_MAG50-1861 [uncultured Acidimicrobiales bacterium]|uniref:Uncharacterized protein n=1 Tax=uncultured Acidimicrobiales bacterium TaxID=310071 RepID=A0A6J4I7L5_9ACTN|nr:MAG: hypothetical protein AVDCRST_MAG50-1861 [uncultured Acidimicrobiales bacterium]
MPRRQRQRAELSRLCEAGALTRAVDLAFEHFTDFGPDREIVLILAEALDRTSVPAAVRHRFAELCAELP